MKLKIGILLIITAAASALSYATVTLRAQEPAAAAGKTTWDGIYSSDQATKGAMLYDDQCARCHGAGATGADAPTLVGSDFASDWDGLKVAELFNRIRDTMPQDNPQSLSRDDTAALVAYVLSVNNFPAGDSPLASDGTTLGQLKYLATKP